MTSWLGDWANLLLRWAHFIAGIAWIGSSFYFIWLDRALIRPEQARPGVEGDLWMVHSGGFYQVEKRRPGPGEVPPVLHWFKWEAMLTGITGIALLVLIFYLGGAYLLDPGVSRIGRGAAIALGLGIVIFSWPVYDGLWRSPLAHRPTIAVAISLTLLTAVTILLCRLLSGRAAFMHVGALLGTIMVANVWERIIPAQRQMVDAGWMHGYMRMYWAKKILEWSPSPRIAYEIAVRLNDRATYDLLPSGPTGQYWADGVLLGSTLWQD